MQKDFFINELDLNHAISTNADAPEVSDYQKDVLELSRSFDIDLVYFSDDFPAVFIKNVPDFTVETLKKIADIHHDVWNYKKVLQLYAISEVEIRIYNCSEKPIFLSDSTDFEKETATLELFRCHKTDSEKLSTLNKIFSRIAVDTGIIWTIDEAIDIRKKINLQKRVDKFLVNSLIKAASVLKTDNDLDIDLIHKLMMRSLFLLFLEDRNATDAEFYNAIDPLANNYFDILGSVSATYKLFSELETHFKGNLFTVDDFEEDLVKTHHLDLIKRCFITGFDNPVQVTLFEGWRVFNFNIIEIELLSEIYENFLSAIDSKKKDETGTFYTPPSLVELILNEKLPVSALETAYNIKILDPACGSGIFLVESFKRLIKRYETHTKQKLTDYAILKEILLENIFGIELDIKAIKVTAFSLYLALLENLNPKTLWQHKELPNLICDPLDNKLKAQGKNLYRTDTIIINAQLESLKFDLVIGNPPFGTKNLSKSVRDYCSSLGYAQEMVLPFIHKGAKFAADGEVALIFNTKVLTNTGKTYQKFRTWLFNECYVEKIYNFSILRKVPKNFGGQLFGSATGPISILFFKTKAPDSPSDNIVYYAPKTYLKMDILEGIAIDSTDVKYLPRVECSKANTKIWKIAMWGGMSDINLIEKLNKLPKLKAFIKKKNISKGVGLQFLDNSTKNPKTDNEIPSNYIAPKSLNRYISQNFIPLNKGLTAISKTLYAKYYRVKAENLPPINIFRRLGSKEAFKAPHILIKEGLKDWEICASYFDADCSFNSKVVGLHHADPKLLKGLTCFINSKLAYYYLFMVSASIGIEREEIKPNEIYDLPFTLTEEQLYELAVVFESETVTENFLRVDYSQLQNKVDTLVFKFFDISLKHRAIIDNAIDVTFPLLFYGSKATSLLPANTKHFEEYSSFIIQELRGFVETSELILAVVNYQVDRSSPLAMIKITYGADYGIQLSKDGVNNQLKKLDKRLYKKGATNIYFRKKINYYDGNDIYIIRPNQKRFWSKGAAIEDANDLLSEILNMH